MLLTIACVQAEVGVCETDFSLRLVPDEHPLLCGASVAVIADRTVD